LKEKEFGAQGHGYRIMQRIKHVTLKVFKAFVFNGIFPVWYICGIEKSIPIWNTSYKACNL
jgi:hypothetical protein